MPRSNWKGVISFGLVTIPVVLFNSIEPASSVSFKQINRKTGDKIKYKRVDVETEKEVPWEDIGKAVQYSKDIILPVAEDELKRVAGDNARTIAIEEFIDQKEIDFVHVQHTYYLVPDKKGEKGYVILREALSRARKVGLAKVIISTKEYLAAVSTYKDALVVYLLHYQDEIRPLSEFDIPSDDIRKYKVNSKEIDIAKKLIDSMSAKWKPEKFKDEYKIAVEQWVKEKVHKLPETHMKQRISAKAPKKAVNFVDLLRKSLETRKVTHASSPQKRSKAKPRHIPHKEASNHRRAVTRH